MNVPAKSPETLRNIASTGDKLFRAVFEQSKAAQNPALREKAIGSLGMSLQMSSLNQNNTMVWEQFIFEPTIYLDHTDDETPRLTDDFKIRRITTLEHDFTYKRKVEDSEIATYTTSAISRHPIMLAYAGQFAVRLASHYGLSAHQITPEHSLFSHNDKPLPLPSDSQPEARMYPRHIYQTLITGQEGKAWLTNHHKAMNTTLNSLLDKRGFYQALETPDRNELARIDAAIPLIVAARSSAAAHLNLK